MAGTYSGIRKPMSSPVKREDRRRIPLTAFTLLTVPEEPMLSAYLRTKESIDVSLAKRMVRVDSEQSGSFRSGSDSSQYAPECSPKTDDSSTTKGAELVLELDMFMAALTASESPDAIIKIVVGTKNSKPARK